MERQNFVETQQWHDADYAADWISSDQSQDVPLFYRTHRWLDGSTPHGGVTYKVRPK